jgi:hypothetical protein
MVIFQIFNSLIKVVRIHVEPLSNGHPPFNGLIRPDIKAPK